MLLLIPPLLALAVSLAFGGTLRPLADLHLRGRPLIIIGLAVQVALYLPGVRTHPVALRIGGALYVGALALLLAAALSNWRLGLGLRVAALGVALNTVVIAANGGHMPVERAAALGTRGAAQVRALGDGGIYRNTHIAGPGTRLGLLDDRIPIRPPVGPANAYSIGDALLAVGGALLLYRLTRPAPARPAAYSGARRRDG